MQLSNKEIRLLNDKIKDTYSVDRFFGKKDRVERNGDIIYQNSSPVFFVLEDKLIPTLKLLLSQKILPYVVVDMPAVPFMIKGADCMRPGIVSFEVFEKDSFVVIVDEKNKKPLAVGKALFSSEEIKSMDKGKVLKNVHFVGDDVWDSGSK